MAEGVIHGADAASFKKCFSLSWKNPYILRLAASAGIGGFLFGYDTGVISGALLYIRDDFKPVDRSTELQEFIVSGAVAGAIFGAASGGYVNDRLGRKFALMLADILFFIGAVLMAAANGPALLIVGRIFVGFGVGMASMTGPLYISEASPSSIRGALVSLNAVFITGGQFIAYLINLAFTKAPGTWRWMLGVAGLPAVIQFGLMICLPESPRWLYRKGKEEEAKAILRRVHPPENVEQEIQDLKDSVDKEVAEQGDSKNIHYKELFKTTAIRRALIAGVGLQIFQQFVGINTVMYYSPAIIQLAGFASNQTALLLSLITAGLNAIGSFVSVTLVDKFGRKKLLIGSLSGVIVSLAILTAVFNLSASHAPAVMPANLQYQNFTCPAYATALNSPTWNCMTCLKESSDCGFCAGTNKLLPGMCIVSNDTTKDLCGNDHRDWFTRGCPSKYGTGAIFGMALYIIFFAPGMGAVTWVVNSEIYPLRFRGICGGIAATANWSSNLIVSQTFLTLTKVIGTDWTFLLLGVISIIALAFVLICVPETKGLPIEEVEKMLENRPIRLMFWKNHPLSTIEAEANGNGKKYSGK